jgi:outer membrane immunogenic protein
MYWGRGISNSLLVGYSVGGGLEWMFVPNWSLKGEALYYSLGNMNVSNVAATSAILGQNEPLWAAQAYSGTGLIAGQTSINYQGIIARAGVNYHFNFASVPVVAKF